MIFGWFCAFLIGGYFYDIFGGWVGRGCYFLCVYYSLHLGPSWNNCFILTKRSVQIAGFSSSSRVAAPAALFTRLSLNIFIWFKAHSCLNWVLQVLVDFSEVKDFFMLYNQLCGLKNNKKTPNVLFLPSQNLEPTLLLLLLLVDLRSLCLVFKLHKVFLFPHRM